MYLETSPFGFGPIGTRILFGCGLASRLGTELLERGWKRAFVLTDPGVAAAGISDHVVRGLRNAGIDLEVFSEVPAETSAQLCERLAVAAKDFKVDVIVGLGGGSVLDTAKAIATALTNPKPLTSYKGLGNVERAAFPMVAVPTTAGTGSEASIWIVLFDDEAGVKLGIGSPHVVPVLAICDPELTVTLPPSITASSGLDALAHAVESYTNNAWNPISDALTLKAVELIGEHLRGAVRNGRRLEHRYGMMLGATLAAMGMNDTRLGLGHAIAMFLGYRPWRVPHAVAVAVLLPYVMEFNYLGATRRFARLARALGEPVDGLTERDAARRAVQAVQTLINDVGMNVRLGVFGLTASDLDGIAERALQTDNATVNPRLVTKADIVEILKSAL
ncbi:MAG: iron-containing alcohol dehydrogenase [Bacillota bacterium]